MLIDTHCHLTDEAFREDREAVVHRALEAGVAGMITIASSVPDARAALELAGGVPEVRCTVGVHPHQVAGWTPEVMEQVRALAEGDPRVVALGETGLDHHYDHGPRDLQLRSFRAHLELGARLDLPVVVHCRSAVREVEAALAAAPSGTRGVLHCFAGDEALMDTALGRGWYLSFGGMVTFARYDGADLLRRVPADRLLLETDSPYLAPAPFRGRRNEPAHMTLVRDAVARIRGEDPEEVEEVTGANAARLFQVTFPRVGRQGEVV